MLRNLASYLSFAATISWRGGDVLRAMQKHEVTDAPGPPDP